MKESIVCNYSCYYYYYHADYVLNSMISNMYVLQ